MKRHGKGLSEAEVRRRVEHVLPSSQGGPDALPNRALACAFCNLAKSDRTRALDAMTGEEVCLFNPRQQDWDEHFCWFEEGEILVGLTTCGRATVAALDLNNELHREARRLWFTTGSLP